MVKAYTYNRSRKVNPGKRGLHTLFALLVLSCCLHISCDNKDTDQQSNLSSVKIGDQVWAAASLDVVSFSNGDSIPQLQSKEDWEKAGKEERPAWCNYENDTSIGRKYGRIYNWYAINDPRGIAPEGWHVPTNDEWITLENFLGTAEAGLRLKCNAGPNKNGNGNNSSKFCALLGGYRGKEGGFSGIEEFTYLSSSTERDQKENDIWGRGIQNADSTIMRCGLYKGHGLYVRLIKD